MIYKGTMMRRSFIFLRNEMKFDLWHYAKTYILLTFGLKFCLKCLF